MANNTPTSPTFFCKSQRLLTSSEFKYVFDNPAKKIHSQHLLLFVRNGQASHARLGLAITKKKVKSAVMRNHLKRLTREHFRVIAYQLEAVDIVLIVKKTYTKQSNLNIELAYLFEKLAILYPVQYHAC